MVSYRPSVNHAAAPACSWMDYENNGSPGRHVKSPLPLSHRSQIVLSFSGYFVKLCYHFHVTAVIFQFHLVVLFGARIVSPCGFFAVFLLFLSPVCGHFACDRLRHATVTLHHFCLVSLLRTTLWSYFLSLLLFCSLFV